MTTDKKFSHRHNSDGTIDSICHQCFATIATQPRESDLYMKERMHTCERALVAWYQAPHRSIDRDSNLWCR
jgi:hypothetical protein